MKYQTEKERREAHLVQARAYSKRHPERRRISKEKWRAKNMERYRLYAKRQREKFPEKYKQAISKWSQKNSAYLNAKKAERMARRKKAMPAWANRFFMQEIYDLARRRTECLGTLWSVDHIVPLTSSVVCGLHTEHNLRVIPHFENISKLNRVWPDMP